jgi:hypothetical protein
MDGIRRPDALGHHLLADRQYCFRASAVESSHPLGLPSVLAGRRVHLAGGSVGPVASGQAPKRDHIVARSFPLEGNHCRRNGVLFAGPRGTACLRYVVYNIPISLSETESCSHYRTDMNAKRRWGTTQSPGFVVVRPPRR